MFSAVDSFVMIILVSCTLQYICKFMFFVLYNLHINCKLPSMTLSEPILTSIVEVVDTLGRNCICLAVNQGPSYVTNQLSSGYFPAKHAVLIRSVARLKGYQVADEAFNFILPEPHGEAIH